MKQKTTKEFVTDAMRVHGDKYDYSLSKYTSSKSPVIIICPVHGEFKQTPNSHISNKSGCKLCALENRNKRTTSQFVKLLKSKYNDRFLYDNVVYDGTHSKVKLKCHIHGWFEQYAYVLLNGDTSCPKCGYETTKKKNLKTNATFLRECSKLNTHYDYSMVVYSGDKSKVTIVCPKHGAFKQTPNNHINKKSKCPRCNAIGVSEPEKEINELLCGTLNDKLTIYPYELDICNSTVAVEYNGIMWHSIGKSKHSMFDNWQRERIIKNKHLNKTEKCEELGIQLFHIFENEWLSLVKKPIWVSVLNNKMNKSNRLYARKCTVKEVPSKKSNQFLDENHLQGKCNASVRLGLYHGDELVSLMTFGKSRYDKSIEWELIRFCSKLEITVVGGASKLLRHFEREYQPTSIISYANRRWSCGSLYEKLGFKFIKNTKPNYFYFKPPSMNFYSRTSFQKHKLKDKLVTFCSALSESENMYNNGYRKIYDCGNKVYLKYYKN